MAHVPFASGSSESHLSGWCGRSVAERGAKSGREEWARKLRVKFVVLTMEAVLRSWGTALCHFWLRKERPLLCLWPTCRLSHGRLSMS